MPNHHELSNFIWQIADLLRGPYRPPQYERVMLPMTVLRRFDCVLEPTKAKVLAEHAKRKGGKLSDDALDRLLNRAAGQRFHNHSPLTFEKLKGDPDNIEKHLVSYIKGFSANVRTVFDFFEFENEIEKMREANILFLVVSKFCEIDLHPDAVDNIEMGLLFENLIRRFNELANETAGDHFTPRDVIRLMVSLLFLHDDDLLSRPGTVRKLLDCACGTGGMLAEVQNYMRDHHAEARLYVYGQDYNKRAFATAASDMLIKQVDHNGTGDNVRFGDSFTEDQFEGETFDYFLANVPFGVDWKKQQKEIVREHEKLGFAGRFGAGLPRVNDGSLLFLQHMCNYSDVYKHEFITLALDFMRGTATEAEIAKFRLHVGDVVITKDSESWDDIGIPALVTESADDLVCGYHLAILRPQKHMLEGRFLFRCLQAKPVREQLELAANGVTRFGIPKEEIGLMLIPVPDREKQRAIADFLDRETARLDALVSAKERLLAILAEKRRALITRAVTRGVNPDVPLRDSEVPWLGRIPAHWEVKRIAALFTERDEREEPDLPLLNVSLNTGVSEREFAEDRIERVAADFNAYKVARKGDIAFNKMRMWQGAVGVVPTDGLVSPDYTVAFARVELEPSYYGLLFRLAAMSAEFARSSHGIVWDRLRLYWEGFRETRVPVPPVSDQRAIVAHVESETAKLDALRAATERTIGLLKERRAALIAAAVTGIIDVRMAGA